MKKQNTQQGFSAVELILIIVVIGLLGGLGWYVWAKGKDTKPATTTSSPAKVVTSAAKPAVDPTADWVLHTDVAGKFTLKHPKTWVEATHPELCSQGIYLIGADKNSVGVCASEGFGQIAIISETGDAQAQNKLSTGYTSVTETKATVNGVNGVRDIGTASGQMSGDNAIGGYADGTKVVKYIFFTNGRTYSATYVKTSTSPDVLSDFDLMVTKTLMFTK